MDMGERYRTGQNRSKITIICSKIISMEFSLISKSTK